MKGQRAPQLRLAPVLAVGSAASAAAVTGLVPPWPGLVHVVGLPPLDLVTDLGALLVHAPGWPAFVAGLAVSLGVRSLVLSAMLGGLSRDRFLFALRFYCSVLPVALVAAGALFAAKALLFYALFWLGAAVTVALLLVAGALPWLGSTRLTVAARRGARAMLRAGTVGAYLAVLFALGWLADATAPVGPIVLTPVSAVLTWATAQALLVEPGWRWARRSAAALPAALAVALVVVVLTGPAAPAPPEDGEVTQAGSVMLMSGIDSSSGSGAILELDPRRMGWPCERTFYFSYAGPGDGQPRNDAHCEIHHGAPYDRVDTLRSRLELVPFLEAQVAEMVPPAVVAGHSQGAWLVWDAGSRGRLPGVEAVVLVGPFPENPVSYPPPGVRAPGRVGRVVLQVVAELPRPGGTSVFRVDSPLGREWLGHPDRIEQTMARPLAEGIRALSITSSFDLPLMTGSHRIDGVIDACPVPVVHPNLPYAAEVQDQIARFAAGRDLIGCSPWRTAVGGLFRHFAVPPTRW